MEKTLLSQEELGKIQEMNNEFTKAKLAIGDLEMQKHNILKAIEVLRADFSKHEIDLVAKYGQDSVINIQTGEVTKKED
jgi:lipopolysaccharide biosynthesis regulator YciM